MQSPIGNPPNGLVEKPHQSAVRRSAAADLLTEILQCFRREGLPTAQGLGFFNKPQRVGFPP